MKWRFSDDLILREAVIFTTRAIHVGLQENGKACTGFESHTSAAASRQNRTSFAFSATTPTRNVQAHALSVPFHGTVLFCKTAQTHGFEK